MSLRICGDPILFDLVGDRGWASELCAYITAEDDGNVRCEQLSEQSGDGVSIELDPDAAWTCVNCEMQFTIGYSGARCADCGSPVMDRTGALRSDYADDVDDDFEDGDDGDTDVLRPFPTDNPFLQRIFQLPTFGHAAPKALELFRSVSPDPDEFVLAAIRTQATAARRGLDGCRRAIQRYPDRLASR